LSSIKKIMVGTDGSEASCLAVDAAVEQAKLNNASLHIVTAIGYSTPYVVTTSEVSTEIATQVKSALDGAKKIAEDEGVTTSTQILKADSTKPPLGFEYDAPAEKMLVRHAQEENIDLIVVGSHGRTGIDRMLLGSVSEYVISHAPCAVLVVRPKKG